MMLSQLSNDSFSDLLTEQPVMEALEGVFLHILNTMHYVSEISSMYNFAFHLVSTSLQFLCCLMFTVKIHAAPMLSHLYLPQRKHITTCTIFQADQQHERGTIDHFQINESMAPQLTTRCFCF